jgi:hypothetical protein
MVSGAKNGREARAGRGVPRMRDARARARGDFFLWDAGIQKTPVRKNRGASPRRATCRMPWLLVPWGVGGDAKNRAILMWGLSGRGSV